MKKTLRPYQQEAVDLIKQSLPKFIEPILVTASVGAGKSICIAEILRWIQQGNSKYNVLCLTLSSILVQQNAEAYQNQGGTCGIFCSSLKRKEVSQIMFATPHSVWADLKDNGVLSQIPINLIVIDEAHNISPTDEKTMFRQILNHYGRIAQTNGHSYRIIGLTGTPYRGKGDSIIGEKQFFKKEICNISASWLISQGFLTKPTFGLPKSESYNFSHLRTNHLGKFKERDLEAVIAKDERLTGKIMRELTQIMENRRGAFIFCCTKRHCEEAARSLPREETRIITAETPHDERQKILEEAKQLRIRFLVNVNVLLVGIDVPIFDVCVFLRPTESLVLFTQAIGRVLRLHPEKNDAIVLDYAGNLERHGDIDDPIINEALQPKEDNEKEYIIPCCACGVENTIHARRCIGINDAGRCENYFIWKDCGQCGAKNDSTSRLCRCCENELIDPNAKLRLIANEVITIAQVAKAAYWVSGAQTMPCFNARYHLISGDNIQESFVIRESRTANIFYAKFLRLHMDNASKYYKSMRYLGALQKMIHEETIKTPYEIHYNEQFKIKKKVFHE